MAFNRLSFVCVLLFIFVLGCSGTDATDEEQNNVDTFVNGSLGPASAATKVATPSLPVKRSPIEVAHKEYIEAYDEYVRLLRQEGPQTRKTLNALAEYQRKYRVYQMLLDAQKD